MNCDNGGYIASGASAFLQYGWGANIPAYPYNNYGDATGILPNLQVSSTVANCAGLKNILQNSAITGTGLYWRYRIWSVHTSIIVLPQVAADCCEVALTCYNTNTSATANVMQAAQAPFSRSKLMYGNNTSVGNTLNMTNNIPRILGIPMKDYEASASDNYGTYTTLPVTQCFYQLSVRNAQGNAFNSNVPYFVKTQYHIEFFMRTDTALFDT